jgi:L-fuconolactonase
VVGTVVPGEEDSIMTTPIDSHVHFWDRDRFAYAWLDEAPEALSRPSFLPADADPGAEMIFVQADCREDQALAEAAWVQGLADAGAPIVGIVAHAPLERDCGDQLEALSRMPLVAGIRRLLQDEPPGFANSDAFISGVAQVAPHGFAVDLCIRQWQLDEVTELVAARPEVQFVLDHLGKPVIDDGEFDSWAASIDRLAALPNVACKVSGLLTEAPPSHRDADSLRPWILHALDAFGADRLMYGTDWPVLTLAGDAALWRAIVDAALQEESDATRDAVFGGTARRIYRV